jgi:hypothetical protein
MAHAAIQNVDIHVIGTRIAPNEVEPAEWLPCIDGAVTKGLHNFFPYQ